MRSLLLTVLLVATGCGHTIIDVTKPPAQVVFSSKTGGATLTVGIADTPETRGTGLSGITHLSPGYGMAFVYRDPSTDEFWMKDTLIPLAIAFVRADGTIIALRQMTPCVADPCRTYGSPGPYLLAIEASPNWYAANEIGVGDTAVLGNGIG